MAVEHPGSINPSHTSTHPATPERFLEINAAIKEIEEKKKLNQKLTPQHKRGIIYSSEITSSLSTLFYIPWVKISFSSP